MRTTKKLKMYNYKKKILSICFGICLYLHLFSQSYIPIDYDQNKKGIVINAIINDTLNTRLFFDTGVSGLIVADSLNIFNGSELTKCVQIGNSIKYYYDFPNGKPNMC